jgi:hypothetical protein
MKPLLQFEEFLKKGVIIKRTPENSRALFLFKESKRKQDSLKQILEKIGLNETNTHDIIEYCYDILIYLVRAKLYEDGFTSIGEGSHEAEVAYMRVLGFPEKEVLFLNQLRYFRNGIKYYGTILDQDYANKVLFFLNSVYPRLVNQIRNKN